MSKVPYRDMWAGGTGPVVLSHPLTENELMGAGVVLGKEGQIIQALRGSLEQAKVELADEQRHSAELRKRLDKFSWISVSDRVPETRYPMLAVCVGKVYRLWYSSKEKKWHQPPDPVGVWDVKFWMPLPEPPKCAIRYRQPT